MFPSDGVGSSNETKKTNDSNEIICVKWVPIEYLKTLNVNRTLAKIIKKWRNIFPIRK